MTDLFKENTRFFISNTFISNVRLRLPEIQAKAKQHPEAELLLFENYSLSSSTLSYKNNKRYSKILHRYDINRARPRHRHKYTKYKMCLNVMMVICIRQQLSNI